MTARPSRAPRVVLAAGVAVIVACSGGHATTPAPVPVPHRAGDFRAGIVGLTTLDPAQARSPGELQVARALYSPLTTWNARTLQPEPGLAASWSSSADLRVWTFVLRRGATFSDGRPVTAADVRATFERVVRRESASPSASLLSGIAGYDVMRSTAQSGLAIDDAGGGAVRITTTASLAVLPSILASPTLGILPAEVSVPFPDTPIGSGPFLVASRSSGGLRLERSPGSSAGLESVELVTFTSDEATWQAFQHDELDWSPVPADAVVAPDAAGMVTTPVQAELFYGFNVRDPVVGNVAVRLAALHGVDRHRIADSVYRRAAIPLDAIVTPVDGVGCRGSCGLEPAPLHAGVTISVEYEQEVVQDAVAHALSADLAKVGITAQLDPKPLADFQALAASGGGQLTRLGWVAPYPGPDAELAPLFGSGLPDNFTGFSSPSFDAAIAAARAEADPVKRDAQYRKAEKIVLDAGVVIPLVQFEMRSATASRVRGLDVDGMGGWDPARVSMTIGGR